MEKLIYKYDKNFDYWTVSQFVSYPKSEMILLKMSFNPQNYWIIVDIHGENIAIWDSFDEEDTLFEKIPKLRMSKQNYEEITELWNQNFKKPAEYLIFCRDNNGMIHLEVKNELSQDDLTAIEEDRLAKLKYEQS